MKNKILATLLSFTLIFTTTGFSFADDEVAQVPEPEKQTEQVVKEDVKAQIVEKKEVKEKEVIVKDEVTKVEATPEETEEYVAPTEATTPAVNVPESTSGLDPPRIEAIYKSDTYSVTYNIYYRYPAGNGWKLGGTKTFDFPQNGVSSSWRGINVAYNQMVGNNVDKPFVYEGVEYIFNGKWEDENGNSYDRDSRLTGKEYSTDTVVNIYAQYNTKNMCKFTLICTDEVSTGSGSWSEEAGAATTFSHTFTNPLDKTPVEGYEFLYWENVNDSKEKYKASETYTCDLTKLKEDTTVEFVAVYTQIYALKINDAEKLYGADDPKFTAEWNGPFKIQWKYIREPGENVGEYKITAKITGMDEPAVKKTSNYKIVIEDALLRIYPRTVWVDIDDFSKEYGEKDPDFGTAKVTSDDSDGFKVPYPELKYAVGRVAEGEDVDVYKNALTLVDYNGEEIEVMTLNNQNTNYVFKINKGDFEITPREITIAAVYKFKTLEDVTDEEDFDATVTGLLEQDEEWFEEEVCWDVDCDYDIAVGDYPIIITAEWEPDIFIIDDPVFPCPGEFEEWPMEQMKQIADVPMMTAKSVGLKKNSTIIAGNYTIKTVDNVFQIRDKEEPPVPPVDPDTPDTPVINPDNNGGNNDVVAKTDKDTKQGVISDKSVKTGDNAFLMVNVLLLMAALVTWLSLILTKRFRRDDE